jgi:hypothetical protein
LSTSRDHPSVRRAAATTLVLSLSWSVPTVALRATLTTSDIERAQAIARGSDRERARFHDAYTIAVNDASVERVEIVTEFRRYVLVTEQRLRQGDWLFSRSVRSAQAAVAPFRGRATLMVRLRFDPLNSYADVPRCDLIVGGLPDVDILAARVTPLNSQPFRTSGGTFATSMLGASAELDLNSATLGDTRRPVTVLVDGREVSRFIVDFTHVE